jgi:hypothetical protein
LADNGWHESQKTAAPNSLKPAGITIATKTAADGTQNLSRELCATAVDTIAQHVGLQWFCILVNRPALVKAGTVTVRWPVVGINSSNGNNRAPAYVQRRTASKHSAGNAT